MTGIESLIVVLAGGFAVGLIIGRRMTRGPQIAAGSIVLREPVQQVPDSHATADRHVPDEIDQLIGELARSPTPRPQLVRRPARPRVDTQPLWTLAARRRTLARGSTPTPMTLDDLMPQRAEPSVIVDDDLLVRWASQSK